MTRFIKDYLQPHWHYFAFFFLISAAAAIIVPITMDEAYYWNWATALDWGYFDHPPLVALQSWLSRLGDATLLSGRLLTIVIAFLTTLVLGWTYALSGLLRDRQTWRMGMLVAFLNFGSLFSAILTTPDSMLILSWALCLLFLVLARLRDHKYWLGVGFAAGLAFSAKYTAVLLGPVILSALFLDKRLFRSRWPYLGGLLALCLIAPNLVWNAKHDWVTLQFQINHGFERSQDHALEEGLPRPSAAPRDQEEFAVAHAFDQPKVESAEELADAGPTDAVIQSFRAIQWPQIPFLEPLKGFLDFLGGQIALFGFLAIPMIASLVQRIRRRQRLPMRGTDPVVRKLMIFAATFPFVFFGCISFNSKIEANWAVPYLLAFAPLIAPALKDYARWIYVCAVLNLCAFGVVAVHSRFPMLKLRASQDRVLKETHGFEELAAQLARFSEPIFGDSYQITSMLRYYSMSQNPVDQWPNLNRPSEFVRRPEFIHFKMADLQKGFLLVTSDKVPPTFAQFRMIGIYKVNDCKKRLQWFDPLVAPEAPECAAIHTWYVARYRSG